jgi:hypothetical protein
MHQEKPAERVISEYWLRQKLQGVTLAAPLRSGDLLPRSRLALQAEAFDIPLVVRTPRVHGTLSEERKQVARTVATMQVIEAEERTEILDLERVADVNEAIDAPVVR